MAKVIDKEDTSVGKDFEEEVDNELEEDIDNNESFDLEGDSDEDIDSDTDDLDEDGSEEEVDEDEELDDSEDNEDSESEDNEEENGEEVDEDSSNGEEEQQQETSSDNALEEENRALRKQLANVKHLSKETLTKMGIDVKDGDVVDTMERTVAESEGISVEEYRQRREADALLEQQKANEKIQKFEQLAANDLAEVKKSFPDLLEVKKIRDCFDSFEDFAKFGKLRDSGIDAKTAYLAVNGDKVRVKQAQASQKKASNDGKKHITSVAPKKASDDNSGMSKEELREWRETFPDLSIKEIKKLYKDTK